MLVTLLLCLGVMPAAASCAEGACEEMSETLDMKVSMLQTRAPGAGVMMQSNQTDAEPMMMQSNQTRSLDGSLEGKDIDLDPSICPFGEITTGDKSGCHTPDKGELMTFFMYRAQDEQNYATNEGLNLANPAGVLWYLHNEVIGSCPRKFGITRVLRYKVTMKAADLLVNQAHRNFDMFMQFDAAKCTNPMCKTEFDKYGYNVGCIINSMEVGTYQYSTWYSLPGVCPFQEYWNKSDACRAEEPGGECAAPDGGRTCTWHLEPAGELTFDELTGQEGCPEDEANSNFWIGQTDQNRCNWRINYMGQQFAKKYPNEAADYGQPKCDWR